ncbi:carbon monoxide dehydrogenase [Heliophilum fasciatum]|uniref:Carbon-monoxide dehydrogenase catalytic subunit n=1 Tax=Heliophilum fasciatum TaxID=35700 RepID=A0A4R2RMK5_9FIRM|nr:carbon monoxide dehydrogenase [Heliophilum fasciatum]MCW2278108.1 carbon-monoxide dehydrogenase catalytic subunit [Heliophilum fasciatum]TCP64178.1 carbon-monoxide dehydrogenase catalytic subunit [Heliophilum fasciatum]
MHDPQELNEYRRTFPSTQQVLEETPDPGVRAMLRHFADQGLETTFDRFDAQKPQCTFGLAGTCCRNCNMGPCKITPKSPRGVCGADADLIVARNFLRWVAAGVSAHGARGREVMLALKGAAEGTIPLPIRGPEKVRAVAKALGITADRQNHERQDRQGQHQAGHDQQPRNLQSLTGSDDQEPSTEELQAEIRSLAAQIADVLLEDLSRTVPGEHKTLAAMAPPERIATWRDLDILPIGAYHEVFEALHRTGTGTDGDWENIARQILRCGLAFAWSSVLGSSIAMDSLYGPPQRQRISANFGSLKPEYVNIAIHGHSPVMASAIVQAAESPEAIARARELGAAGIRLYGICCSGLSSLYRYGQVHPLSNAIGAELVMGTGALDLWVADIQDVFPSIMNVAACFHTKVVTTHDAGRLPGAIHIGFDHHHRNLNKVEAMAAQIVGLAIENYPRRKEGNVFIPETSIDAEIGFSVENALPLFGGPQGLWQLIDSGQIRGIVNLVGCNNPKVIYEKTITDVADILLANDILILTNGCASFPLLKLGYCHPDALAQKAGPGLRQALEAHGLPPVWHMGECLDNARASALFRAVADAAGRPLKAMPFAFSSPEWSNEKGAGASLSFRLLGLNSYHCVPAPLFGSPNVRKFFEHDTEALLGSVMVVDPDPRRLGERIVADLEKRRSQK